MASYFRPDSLAAALSALRAGPLVVVAGGTDYYPARVGRLVDDDILDVSAISALRGITSQAGRVRIGALTTWSDVAHSDLPGWFDGMRAAAKEVGGAQIQNSGTVAGNICNASPAADGMPPLLSLNAGVELASADGERTLPLGEFVTGNRRTQRRPDELVVGISFPEPVRASAGAFLKLGARRYLVISIAMVAAVIEAAPDGTVAAARIAVGACSEVAQRLPALESSLAGLAVSRALGEVATPAHLDGLSPIDDVRGSREYRRDAALTLVRRILAELGGRL